MIGKGVFKADVGGKEVFFHFGTLSSVYTEEKSGLPIGEVFKNIGSIKNILYYFWGAAVAYNEINNIKEEITVAQVSEWIDAMGIEKTYDIYVKSIQSPASKNGKAPKEAEPVA